MTANKNVAAAIDSAVLAQDPTDGFESAAVPLPKLQGEGKEFAVIDSNVVTYREEVPDDVRNHVTNWILMAQRIASAKASATGDPEAWTNAYLDALTTTGWAVRGSVGSWHKDSATGATMHEKILAVLSVVLGPAPAALAIVTAAITSLQAMAKDSPWITLFNRRAESAQAVGFQVADCVAPQTGGAALEAIDFRVYAEQTITQVLWFTFTSNRAEMHNRRVVLDLSEQIMRNNGAAVEAKVQNLVAANIAGAQLSDTP